MSTKPYYLARFRANPTMVRIRVRPWLGGWRVLITNISGTIGVCEANKSARKALVIALHAAIKLELPGIDYYMDWSYRHPQGSLGRDVTEVTEHEEVH